MPFSPVQEEGDVAIRVLISAFTSGLKGEQIEIAAAAAFVNIIEATQR